MSRFKDITGQRFERVEVLSFSGHDKRGHSLFLCRCDCGKEWIVSSTALLSKKIKSCGCYARDVNTTHGKTNSPEYNSWQCMKDRCLNINNPQYKDYGGRGITICERWVNSFEDFLFDMGERPKGKTLGRKDNDSNYEPSNCRWETWHEQRRNTRQNRWLEHNGTKMIFADWVKVLNLTHITLWRKLKTQSLESIIIQYGYA